MTRTLKCGGSVGATGSSSIAPSMMTLALIIASSFEATVLPAAAAPSPVNDPVTLWRGAKQGDFRALDGEEVSPSASSCLIDAQRAASRLDHDGAIGAIRCFGISHAHDPAVKEVAAEVEAGVAFASGDYEAAAHSAKIASTLASILKQPQDAAELAQTAVVAALLSRQSRQRLVSGTARAVPATRDAAGLMRVPVDVNGSSLDMVVDTGANLSVLSSSAAKRLRLRMIEGEASVGSSTRAAVGVHIGLADRMEVGGLVFANVAFLVLDDLELSPSPTSPYRIDGILGFPVLLATSGFTFGNDGTFTPAPPTGVGARARLRAIGSDLFVETSSGDRYASLHLDTGASTTGLSWLFAERYPDMIAAAPHRTVGAAGAGGATYNEVAELPTLDLRLAGETFHLRDVAVQLHRDANTGPFGVLGQDVLRRSSWYGVDLRNMSLVLGPISDAGSKMIEP